MAGAGYKLFNTGDVLTAAQVNTYLMQQTVMVFASSAARTSALSGVLAEGMVSYLQDTNTLEVYDGSAWVGATGDITGLTAGTGISISSATGPVPTITSDVATTFDAKGDLVVGTGADTFSKLTAGQNGESIVANSSTSTGLAYTAGVGFAQPVINGGMDIWQRGTSIAQTAGANYTADRWQQGGDSPSFVTTTRQSTNDTTNLPFIQYCARVQRNSGSSRTTGISLGTSIESVNSTPYIGRTVTLSFYMRAGSNFSSTSNALRARLMSSTTTDNNFLISGGTDVINQTITLTTSWQRFTYTSASAVSSSAVGLGIVFDYTPTGTAGANDFFEVTGVQVDLGSTALPFRRSGGTLAGERSACERYYVRFSGGTVPMVATSGFNVGTTSAVAFTSAPVTMRVVPTSVEFSNLVVVEMVSNVSFAVTNLAVSSVTNGNQLALDVTSSGLTAGRVIYMRGNASGSPYLGFSAEL